MRKILCNFFLILIAAIVLPGSSAGSENRPSPNEHKNTGPELLTSGQEVVVDATRFFVSSNTQPTIGIFTIMNGNAIKMDNMMSVAADADGIFYNRNRDVLFQLNRTNNVINAYSDVCTSPSLAATSTSGFRNGREIAVVGDKLVAVQDASPANGQRNKLVVYNISASNAISFDKAFAVDINLWGIHADGNTLYAVVDNSNRVAIFEDFFNQSSGVLTPDTQVSIEGLVRTHGITYDAQSDMMLLTDIGSAASATDGAIVVIPNFGMASADGMVTMDEQIRGDGMPSRLGNPVDIAYDKVRERIYVAERANGGGRVLGFNLPKKSGTIAAVYNQDFPGASAIYFSGEEEIFDECAMVDGGMVMIEGGGTEATIVIDGNPDPITFASTTTAGEFGYAFTYVVTDANGMVLSIPDGNTVDFDPAGSGTCLVYGLAYTGNLYITIGEYLTSGMDLSDECYDLSDNYITVNRIDIADAVGQLFVSSNTQALIGKYNIFSNDFISAGTMPSVAADADGIYYDRTNDVLYQLNRTANVINAYSNVSTAPMLTATSTSDFTNGREIAVVGNKLIATQDASDANGMQNRLLIYTISPMSITLDRAFDVDINLWGIHAAGSTLYAVVDNSNMLAVYNDFFSQTATSLSPDAIIAIEGLVRTHGITYDAEWDLMLLTDVGDAASATDGALVVVHDFTAAGADGMVSMDEQIRADGADSFLGNPVDIAFDKERERVYVAERANGGGRVLGFGWPIENGSIAPIYNEMFAGASAIYFSDADDMTDLCELVDGGMVMTEGGDTEITIVIDGNPDMVTFASNVNAMAIGFSFTYVVTDPDGMVLSIPAGNMLNFDPAGAGTCLVHGLSYTGALTITPGDNLWSGMALSDDCYDLSDNWITVNRLAYEARSGQLFVSSNTQPMIGVYDIWENGTILSSTIASMANDADGIYYDRDADVLYQLNRTANVINAYSNVSTAPMLTATSTSDFTNGREIAVIGDKLVATQDASDANGMQNKLLIYNISPMSITLDKTFDVAINLWGIHSDGTSLYAVVDNSSDVAIFNDFFNQPAGALSPNAVVTIEGLVRTHGITYDAEDDVMLLTDVGDAASATDGALIVISGFAIAAMDGMVSMDEQIRGDGAESLLGNPVDIAWDKGNGWIFIAERANGGGRVLGFEWPMESGSIAPVYNELFAGASAIVFSGTMPEMPVAGPATMPEQQAIQLPDTAIGSEIEMSIQFTQVYPVPAVEHLNVKLNSEMEQEVSLAVFNAAGKLMSRQRINLQAGDNLRDLDISGLPAGMYFLRIPEVNATSRFVKANKQ